MHGERSCMREWSRMPMMRRDGAAFISTWWAAMCGKH